MPSQRKLTIQKKLTVGALPSVLLGEEFEVGSCMQLDQLVAAGQTHKIFLPWMPQYQPSVPGATAELTLAGITFTAVQEGDAGNQLAVELAPGSGPTSVYSVNGNDILIEMASQALTRASLTASEITFTAVQNGSAGNALQLAIVEPIPDGSLSVTLINGVITITLAKTSGVVTGNYADDLAGGWAALASQEVKDLVTISGTPTAQLLLAALPATHLSGGLDPLTASVDSVVADYANAPAQVKALITVSGTGGAISQPSGPASLVGGLTAIPEQQVLSTVSDLKVLSIGLEDSAGYVSDPAGPSSMAGCVSIRLIDVNHVPSSFYKLDAPLLLTPSELSLPPKENLLQGYPVCIEVVNGRASYVVVDVVLGF